VRRGRMSIRGTPIRRGVWAYRHPMQRVWWRPYRRWWWRPYPWIPLWRPFLWWPRLFLMGGFMILLYETLSYKLRREDVRTIERETGKPANELTEDELVAAMKRKGIQQHEVTPEDREAITRSRTKARYCRFCGAPLASDGRYCAQCGHQTTY
jgi:hypothetical protein